MGLPLPSWCSQEDYAKLDEHVVLFYDAVVKTQLMRKYTAGPVIEQFLSNIDRHVSGADRKKIYLYSAHDINVGIFTRSHNFTEAPKIPEFGSTVIIETLRGADEQIYIRVCTANNRIVTLIQGLTDFAVPFN